MSARRYKVLHGFQASAGQPGLIARGLREIGVDAANVIVGHNRFGYPADFHFPDASRTTMRRVLAELGGDFDIIHIHAITPFYTQGLPVFPMGTDLLALKAAGKRIVIHFRGSEVRLPSVFQVASPYNYVADDPEGLVARFPEAGQRLYIDLCRSIADEMVVTDPELLSYVPGAKVIPRAIDMADWSYVGLPQRERPLIVHAPSRQGVKGTRHILSAVQTLKAEGLQFDFQLVENMPQNEARNIYESCDIIVDQLRIGWYGVLATEGMALGKAVVSYIRDDLLHTFGDAPPVTVANPQTIVPVLRKLITSSHLRAEVAERGHAFCRENHDARLVAESCAALYEHVLSRPARIDLRAYMEINESQEGIGLALLADAQARDSSPGRPSRLTPLYWKKLYQLYRERGPGSFLRMAATKLTKGW
ncbi:glycosyltransferase [Microvirga sp. G4-2]|uniref:glycosyltransferase n=1 Tax=Microvirga sp. G4-2 TaxID=3434467 RepID=UPI004044177C